MRLYDGTLFLLLAQLDCLGDTRFEPISRLTRWTGGRNASSVGAVTSVESLELVPSFTECGKLCVSTIVTALLSLLA